MKKIDLDNKIKNKLESFFKDNNLRHYWNRSDNFNIELKEENSQEVYWISFVLMTGLIIQLSYDNWVTISAIPNAFVNILIIFGVFAIVLFTAYICDAIYNIFIVNRKKGFIHVTETSKQSTYDNGKVYYNNGVKFERN